VLDTRDTADAARLRQVIGRTEAVLEDRARRGETHVLIEEVRDLLGIRPPGAPPVPPPPADPLVDPMTGARWAGPPGSSPPAA
jgi:hypothetical protein